MSDYMTWENVIAPKLTLDLRPMKKLKLNLAYGGYWLCSDTDAWVVPGRIDATGSSGDFVGHEIELSARYQLTKKIEIETGYTHFMQGQFVNNTEDADDSDFFYVQVLWRL